MAGDLVLPGSRLVDDGSPSGADPAPARLGIPLTLVVVGSATIGFNRLRVGDWTVSDLIFFLAAGTVLANLLVGQARHLSPAAARRAPTVLTGSMLVLVTAGTLSSFWSWDPVGSMLIVLRLAWITLVWGWLLRAVCPTLSALDKVVLGVRIAVLANAVAAGAGYLGLYDDGYVSTSNRQAAFFSHPNELAGLLVIGLPFFLLDLPRRSSEQGRRPLLLRLLYCGVIGFALLTTGSMTGTIGAVVGVVTLLVASLVAPDRRRAHATPLVPMTIVALLTVCLVVALQSDIPVVERFTRLWQGSNVVTGSVQARGTGNDFVMSTMDRHLLVGAGMGGTSGEARLDEGGGEILNLYLKFLYEGGLPSMFALLVMVVVSGQMALRVAVRQRGRPLHPYAIASLSALVGINVFAQFQPLSHQRYYWLPIALISVIWMLARGPKAKPSHRSLEQFNAALLRNDRLEPVDGRPRRLQPVAEH